MTVPARPVVGATLVVALLRPAHNSIPLITAFAPPHTVIPAQAGIHSPSPATGGIEKTIPDNPPLEATLVVARPRFNPTA